MKNKITNKNGLLPLFYLSVWIVNIVIAILSEYEILPTAYIEPNSSNLYVCSMVSIIITLITIYGGLKFFKFKMITKLIEKEKDNLSSIYKKLSYFRISVFAFCMLINIVLYYATLNIQYAYCLLITALAFVFCWPSVSEIKK